MKNINLRVKPDGRILVSASSRVLTSYIDEFVISKQDFIGKALEQYRRQQQERVPNPVNYEDGERMRLLGKVYAIRVEASRGTEGIFLSGDTLVIRVKDPSNTRHKELLMQKWLKETCIRVFEEVVRQTYERMRRYGVPDPQIKIRSMKTRWGSCQPKRGIITLNSQLIKVPRESIEYVVLHEFAHFIHPDHSKRFWDLVAENMPDYKERRKGLEL